MKVTTTATLEDASVGAMTFVKLIIDTDGDKTRIVIQGMGAKPRASLELTVNTADIRRAHLTEDIS